MEPLLDDILFELARARQAAQDLARQGELAA
jgi:hypothetical protein